MLDRDNDVFTKEELEMREGEMFGFSITETPKEVKVIIDFLALSSKTT